MAPLVLWGLTACDNAPSANKSADTKTNAADKNVSVIQPISEVQDKGLVSGQFYSQKEQVAVELDARSNEDLKQRFSKANAALSDKRFDDAITRFKQITQDYPQIVEPYLNLAAVYTQQNDLQMAREILLQGIDANQKAGMLFTGLKEIHGAIAANAYRKALDTNAESAALKASLPIVDTIVTRFDQVQELQALKSKIANDAKSPLNELQEKQIAELTEKNTSAQASLDKAKADFESERTDLNEQIAAQSQNFLASQAAQREAEARVVRAEKDADSQAAKLKAELAEQTQSLTKIQNSLSQAESLVAEQTKIIAQGQQQSQQQTLLKQEFDALEQSLAKLQEENQALRLQQQQAVIVAQVDPIQQDASEDLTKANDEQQALLKLEAEQLAQQQASEKREAENQAKAANLERQEQSAIARIESWAVAWSAQDVNGYVGHYADDYSSSRSITREQWLEQRQVRLTNKAFIKVKVSNFEIKDLGQQFSVTFDQHYQSNTVDDVVRKRLVFDKNGDDWREAKIVNERLVPKRTS